MTSKVDFSGVRWGSVEWTNLGTLYLRSHESRLQQPILGDRTAAAAIDRIDYDFARDAPCDAAVGQPIPGRVAC
jgi:O-methyltransferase involved in polyketide biosynthesis